MRLSTSKILLSKKAFLNNVSFLKSFAPNSKIFPVVKANAYGHGLKEVVQIVEDYVDGFCFHSLDEAFSVDVNKPILILGHFPYYFDALCHFLLKNEVFFTVYSRYSLDFLEKVGKKINKKIPIFIKVETGTNRLGLKKEDVLSLVEHVHSLNFVFLKGFSTHFANIEDTTDHSYAYKQIQSFEDVIKTVKGKHFLKHNACSAAVLLFDETRSDLIRPGISFYGYYPSKETIVSLNNKGFKRENGLKPALSWVTKPLQIKNVKANEYIGYGLTYRANYNMKIAVLPVGYSDGYDRKLSNNSYVLIRGKRCPVVGRVCMNLFMADVTYVEGVSVEDHVILIGKSENEEITADTLANFIGTINYEVLARINPFIERVVVE